MLSLVYAIWYGVSHGLVFSSSWLISIPFEITDINKLQQLDSDPERNSMHHLGFLDLEESSI